MKTGLLVSVDQTLLALHHGPVDLTGGGGGALLPRIHCRSSHRLRLPLPRLVHLHRREVAQRLVEEGQHSRQVLPLLHQGLVLLRLIPPARAHSHQTLHQVLVVDVVDQHVVDAVHGLVQQVQRDALLLTPPLRPHLRHAVDQVLLHRVQVRVDQT